MEVKDLWEARGHRVRVERKDKPTKRSTGDQTLAESPHCFYVIIKKIPKIS